MADILEHEQITDGKHPIRYLLYPCTGAEWLIVIFSAFANDKSPIRHPYHHLRLLEGIPVHRLYIQDTYGKNGVYYLCNDMDFGVADAVEALIRKVQRSLGCDDAHTIPFGSSKGGSAALYFGLRLDLAHVFSAVPQFRIGTYLLNSGLTKHETLNDMLGTQDREARVATLNMVIEQMLMTHHNTMLHVLTSTGDEQYEEQIVPFLNVLEREGISDLHDICFDERMKCHNDVANRLKDFVEINLVNLMYGCQVTICDHMQTVSRKNNTSEQYQVIYRYEKKDGTWEQHDMGNGSCSVPIEQIWYSEINIWKNGKEIWSISPSLWLEDTASVAFTEGDSGWDLCISKTDACPPGMLFNFQIHDKSGARIYKQPYSSQTKFHVDLALDKGYYLYVLKYRKYAFVSPKIPFQATKAIDIPPVCEYAYEIKQGVLLFCITSIAGSDTSYEFHIIHDGNVILKQSSASDPSVTLKLTDPGYYSVIYFIKNKNGRYQFTSDVKPYLPQKACIYGPDSLKQYCIQTDIIPADPTEDSAFTLIDPIVLAESWETKLFPNGTPDAAATAEMRRAFGSFLSGQTGRPVYVIQWNLWQTNTVSRRLIWILEEFYHICRKSIQNAVELLPLIVTAPIPPSFDLPILDALYQIYQDELRSSLKEVIYRQEFRPLDSARIEVVQHEDQLTAHFKVPQQRITDRFSFYLLRNGKLCKKTTWSQQPVATWPLSEDGVYVVQGMVLRGGKIIVRRTLGTALFGADTREKFDRFCKEDTIGTEIELSKILPFVPETAPFCNILLISQKETIPDRLPLSFPIPWLSECQIGNWNTAIYSQGQLLSDRKGGHAVFSGHLLYHHKLYFGAEVENCLEDIQTLSDQRGQYAYTAWNDKHLEVGADYFGCQQWFYYQTETLFIASNSYYLLLLALKNRNIVLNLDVDKACITLSSAGINLLSQNFCRSMDMKGVYQLTVDKHLRLGKNGWTFSDSEVGRILREDAVYHEALYRKQLNEAAEELIETLSDILEAPQLQKFVVDLDDDLNSRMVYAILSNLSVDRARVKISINSSAGDKSRKLANQINGLYGYPYNDFPQEIEVLSLRDADIRCRNFGLGLYYGYGIINKMMVDPERGNITGGGGEIISRPVYGRKYLNTPVAMQTDCFAFAQSIYDDYSRSFCIGTEALGSAFCAYLGSELSLLPGNMPIQTFENHYFAYYHSCRFGVGDRAVGSLYLHPLQSPKAMRLFQMSYPAHQSIRTQLDLLYQLNPAVAAIPFSSEADNTDLEQLRPELAIQDLRWREMHLNPEADMALWEEAEAHRKAGIQVLNPSSVKQPYPPMSEILYLGLLRNFRILMNACPELCERVGVPLYAHFQEIKNNTREISFWYSKVTSLMDQIVNFSPLFSD